MAASFAVNKEMEGNTGMATQKLYKWLKSMLICLRRHEFKIHSNLQWYYLMSFSTTENKRKIIPMSDFELHRKVGIFSYQDIIIEEEATNLNLISLVEYSLNYLTHESHIGRLC